MNQEAEKIINEFLEKAKNNENAKKLNLADLDGYSGGSQTITMNGVEVSPEDFNNLFLNMADTCGFDIAMSIFRQYCGAFMCSEMEITYTWNGSCSDRDKMGVILYRYWQCMETHKVY